MPLPQLTDRDAALRLAELAVRARMGTLQEGDLVVLPWPDVDNTPHPDAAALQAYCEKYGIPCLSVAFPQYDPP